MERIFEGLNEPTLWAGESPAWIARYYRAFLTNLHNLGGYWANYLLMLGLFFYVGVLPLLERAFVDVSGVVAALGLPVPPLAFVPYGLIGAFLGDHPLLNALWPMSSWRLSEARETLFSLVMFGVALDHWLLARNHRAIGE